MKNFVFLPRTDTGAGDDIPYEDEDSGLPLCRMTYRLAAFPFLLGALVEACRFEAVGFDSVNAETRRE